MQEMKKRRIIFLNGTSSSGKSSLAKALQETLDELYLHISVDGFLHLIPGKWWDDKEVVQQEFPRWLSGFHASAASIARAGNWIILDHVLENPKWLDECVELFDGMEVIFVGMHCSLEELERRELERGDRRKGLAHSQFEKVHVHGIYDIQIDTSTNATKECASVIADYILSGDSPSSFEQLRRNRAD